MSTLALSEGSVFSNRYKVVRCVAMGGMGAVYEVIHLETERRRALKVMHPHLLQSEELRGRFRQEARVAAHVESEFIVDVFDAGIDEATQMPFLVMELLRGEEIGKLLQRRGRFSPAEVVTYLHQAALALDKTHRAHIVHRDLKPENLFLTEREDGVPRIKVLDFGIAKLVADGATHANATRSLGTPLYMAPEQFRSGSSVSPATDMYSLGMMAFTLLVGSIYWLEESKCDGNVFAFATTAMNGPKEPATARAERQGVILPPGFDAWFARATALNPADRFPAASGAIQLLADVLGVPRPGLSSSGPGATAILPSVPMDAVPTHTGAVTGSAIGASTGQSTSRDSFPGGSRNTPMVAIGVPTPKRGLPIAALGLAVGLLGLGAAGLTFLRRSTDTPAIAAPAAQEPARAELPPAAPSVVEAVEAKVQVKLAEDKSAEAPPPPSAVPPTVPKAKAPAAPTTGARTPAKGTVKVPGKVTYLRD